MNKSLLLLSLMFFSSAQAAPITLDFTSGSFSDNADTDTLFDKYVEGGFTLMALAPDNHIDEKGAGAPGNMNFHNGRATNPTTDNNLELTFSGGAFDLTSIDFTGFFDNGISLDLLGSDNTTATITAAGINVLPFLNVTSIIFSVTESNGEIGGAGWDSLTVNDAPSAVPVPAAVWLFGSGLAGLLGVSKRRSLSV